MSIKQILSKHKAALKQDLSGGLLAAIIGLPMGLAFGVQSGLGPQAGIYTAVIAAFIASLFGGTKTLITDPTGPMTVVAASVVGLSLTQFGNIEAAWPLIVGTFVLAGLFELVFGIVDVGRYVKYLPYPVLSGFMAGIGVIIISVQLFPILGHASPKGFVTILTHLDEPISHVNIQALMLGGMTVALIYLVPLISRKIPSILVAIIITTLVSLILNWDVPTIGTIPHELPEGHFSDLFNLTFNDLKIMFVPAIMLGGLGVIDSLLTSVVADNITRTKHNSRWTIIGQGIGNIVTGLFGGLPGAGATMGTVTNIKAGAQTRVSGISKAVFLLIIVLSISDWVAYIPMSVLAGILITIGIGIIDFKGIKMLLKVPREDAAVWIIVLLVTLFDNLLDAVAIGFVLSAVLFIGRMSQVMTETQQSVSLHQMNLDKDIPEWLSKKIYVDVFEGPLFFGFVEKFKQRLNTLTELEAIIFRMSHVPFIDQTGIIAIESIAEDLRAKNVSVFLVGMNQSLRKNFADAKVIPDSIPEENCLETMEDCITRIKAIIEENSEYINQKATEVE